MATDPTKIQLTDEQRALLAKQAEETGRSWAELLEDYFANLRSSRRTPRPGRSFLDSMQERGVVGAMDGPGDLSTNPEHMQGFGESRGGPDTH